MHISYDYSDLIQELEEEINDGILTTEDEIMIQRTFKPVIGSYHAIVDWFYLEDYVDEDLEKISLAKVLVEMRQVDKLIK